MERYRLLRSLEPEVGDKAYEHEFTDRVRRRVRFRTEKGRVVEFVVQLEVNIGDKWQPVVRYEAAHGFAHCDRYRRDGSVERHQPMALSLDQALTVALRETSQTWRRYCRPFLEPSDV